MWFGLVWVGWLGFFFGGVVLFSASRNIGTLSVKVKNVPFCLWISLLMKMHTCHAGGASVWNSFKEILPFILSVLQGACSSHVRLFWETRQEQWAQAEKWGIPSEHKKENFFTGKVLKRCQFFQKGYGVSLEIFESHLDTDSGKLSSWPCVSWRGVVNDIKRSCPLTKILWLEF